MSAQKALTYTLALAVLALIFLAGYQREQIQALTEFHLQENARLEAQSLEMASLRGLVLSHLELVEGMQENLDFLQQQSDILVAAKRSGRNGHKVVNEWIKSTAYTSRKSE